MRRADRLFQLIQILRQRTRPITAAALAGELEVTVRTVYRDVADMVAQRVPIRGEAGLGYVLDRDYHMPPLMLTPDELEAAALGAQWVAGRGDPLLADAARALLAKLTAVVPDRLRPFLAEPTVGAAPPLVPLTDAVDLPRLRASIRDGSKVRLGYRSEGAACSTERIVWPVLIGYVEAVRLLAAWCEMRGAFRHFRIDRIEAIAFLDVRFGRPPPVLRREWQHHLAQERGRRATPRGPPEPPPGGKQSA